MKVAILLITHIEVGNALIDVAHNTFGELPLEVAHLAVTGDSDPDKLIKQASILIKQLDNGVGILVLTDIFGSTPSNIAQSLQATGFNIQILTGLNLPMLFRALNYPHLNLSELTQKALEGGKEGIFKPIDAIDEQAPQLRLLKYSSSLLTPSHKIRVND